MLAKNVFIIVSQKKLFRNPPECINKWQQNIAKIVYTNACNNQFHISHLQFLALFHIFICIYYVVSQCVRIAVWYFRISLSFKPLFNTIIINICMEYIRNGWNIFKRSLSLYAPRVFTVQFFPHCILHLLTHAVLIICCSVRTRTHFFLMQSLTMKRVLRFASFGPLWGQWPVCNIRVFFF